MLLLFILLNEVPKKNDCFTGIQTIDIHSNQTVQESSNWSVHDFRNLGYGFSSCITTTASENEEMVDFSHYVNCKLPSLMLTRPLCQVHCFGKLACTACPPSTFGSEDISTQAVAENIPRKRQD